MAFDLGVYLVVVGATLLILIHLGLMHTPVTRTRPAASRRNHPRSRLMEALIALIIGTC
jgi:multicomponent K+:H+ antiporter subunit A